jgi:tetratricopeptide (TPR) repeat protein
MDTVPETYEISLKKAEEKEKQYEWRSAVKYYQQALLVNSKASALPEILERLGICYDRASRQAQDVESFKQLKKQAVDAYQKAARLFSEDSLTFAKRDSSLATAAYHHSWLASTPSEKKACYDKCCTYSEKALQTFEKAGDQLNYGKTCINLLICIYDSLYIALNLREKNVIAQKGIEWGQKSIASLITIANKRELLQAYSFAALISWYAANLSEREEWRMELENRSIQYSEKAVELSKEVTDPYVVSISRWAAALITLFFTKNIDSSLEYAKDMLQQAIIINDNFLVGKAYYLLAFITDWMIPKEVDPEKQKEKHEAIIQYSENGISALQLVAQDLSITETYQFYIESHSYLASNYETTLVGKRAIAKKAVEGGQKGLESALRSGSPDALNPIYHALSKMLYFLSNLEPSQDDQIKLLEEALDYRKKQIDTIEKAFPSHLWVVGVVKHYTALIQAKLSRSQTEESKKIAFLTDAISSLDDGLRACDKWIQSRNIPSLVAIVAGYEDDYGEILSELYSLTKEKDMLSQTIGVYEDAAEKYKQLEIPSRSAESYWKIARNLDNLGRYQEAAQYFEKASSGYKNAAAKITQFSDFYFDHSLYMRAWGEIENAKSAHTHEDYASAMQHYEKTANLLQHSTSWGYFASNFQAWALLEHAEDLSRQEQCEESMVAFKKAAEMFTDAQFSFEAEIRKIQSLDERTSVIELMNASTRRKDYCLARVNLEQARNYDFLGKYNESAENYGLTALKLETILLSTQTETERSEIETIVYMCRGWQKMKMADARDLPELYREASDLFIKACEHSIQAQTNLLLLGNTALCRALESGTRFKMTKDRDDFVQAKQFLLSAADYYLKAGLSRIAQWTNATQVLFDAYMYMNSAEIEIDPEKKTKTYLLAERCLNRSALLYENAGYTGKKEEILKLIANVKNQREFTLSLGELIAAPSHASSTMMMPAPSLTIEEPIGVSKFQDTLIEAKLSVSQKEMMLGEELQCNLHLANLGKAIAFLARIDELIPSDCELTVKPERYTVVDTNLDFKGRKLSALETETISLRFKPKKKGVYVFKPRVQYMNEYGESRFHDLEQITVNVKQLGILGWLRGPR